MIIGMTDTIRPQIAGTIRCGSKDENRGFPKNSPFFLLHDAPDLAETLGDKPTEIYFTVLFNDQESFMTQDLRYYTKNDLVCRSRHETGSAVASYYGSSSNRFDANVAGLTTTTFPNVLNALVRNCAVKSCPDFIAKRCKVNTNLSIVIPHHSMTKIYTLPNTSSTTMYSVAGAIEERKRKAYALLASKNYLVQTGKSEEAERINVSTLFAGEIFRLFKAKEDTKYFDPSGARKTAKDQDVVLCEHVPFNKYMDKFKDEIHPEDLAILMALQTGINMHQSRALQFNSEGSLQIEAPASQDEAPLMLGGGEANAKTPAVTNEQGQTSVGTISNQAPAAVAKKAATLEEIAESERLAPLFEKIAKLVGVENTPGNRLATVKAQKSLEKTEEYLTKKIADLEKKASKPAPAAKTETKAEPTKTEAKKVDAEIVTPAGDDDGTPVY